ncbi:Signal transduction response regulator, receiver domain [Dillenia turbinata]|uniref:Ethylene receptor n=1 Tax=Dillenia turbinata TaxID=194707 RepID=A0AAN8UHS0_9MAGN
MLKALAFALLLISLHIGFVAAIDDEFAHCNCDEEGFWTVHRILDCQKFSDFLIAVAYFSIPIELLYFISCSNVPFKWVLVQFIAFIVLCGMTHLLNVWTYYGPHSFQLMLSLTIFKLLTALVSCATAITLLTLIPLLLKVKVRELFLRQNVLELDQEVDMMKKQKEASRHVRMLTREIRKSLDKHTILYTTLVELSKTLDLENCAVWMPNENMTEMNLTHELKGRSSSKKYGLRISVNDRDVREVINSKGVGILSPESPLAAASCGWSGDSGSVAAIRMPLLRVANFKGGTPELRETRYAILVLVLPNDNSRGWSFQEIEIVEVVADQVAVALSHAAVLEESQLMREKLEERNRALQQARKNALMASQARNSFQKVMSDGMRKPMHSIRGLLSIFQDEKLGVEQRVIVDTMVKTSCVLSTLINDVMETSTKDSMRFPLETVPFKLHSLIKEACCLAKCVSVYKGFCLTVDVDNILPDHVIGDEKRTFQVILHMVGYLLNTYDGGRSVIFRVSLESGSQGKDDKIRGNWRPSLSNGWVCIKFSIESSDEGFRSGCSNLTTQLPGSRHNSNEITEGLSFRICKKLVQMMQGNIRISPSYQGPSQTMTLLLRFQIPTSYGKRFKYGNSSEQPCSNTLFQGLRVVLAEEDDMNRIVSRMLFKKLGCEVTAVSSGIDCLNALGPSATNFQIVVLDLHMAEMDGFEVAMRIRKFRSRNWPLIIAVTAGAEELVWERCLRVGMNGIIRKPLILRGIAEELQRVMRRNNEGI